MSAPNAYTPVIPIAPFYQFTEFTPAVPNLYWDVYSAEERMKKLCMEMHKMVEYANRLGLAINVDHDIINELEVSWTKLLGDGYVPQFADPLEWDDSTDYAALTIVTYHGNSYTSRQYVPAGTPLDDSEYWVETGNYNAQVEDLRERMIGYEANIANINAIIPATDFSADNTVKEYIDAINTALSSIIPATDFSADNTVKEYIDAINTSLSSLIALRVYKFATTSEMTEYANFEIGDICLTGGYYAPNDGGGASYIITDSVEANNIDILECSNYNAQLLIYGNSIKFEQLGYEQNVNLTDKFDRAFQIADTIYLSDKTYNTDVLELPSGVAMIGNHATIKGDSDNGATLVLNGNNTICNIVVDGNRTAIQAGNENMHGILIQGDNCKIDHCVILNNHGDGIYINGYSVPVENTLISNTIIDNSFRNGISIINATDFIITDCVISNTNGVSPEFGIDFEPDLDNQTIVGILNNVKTINNRGGLYFAIRHTANNPWNVVVTNYTSINDGFVESDTTADRNAIAIVQTAAMSAGNIVIHNANICRRRNDVDFNTRIKSFYIYQQVPVDGAIPITVKGLIINGNEGNEPIVILTSGANDYEINNIAIEYAMYNPKVVPTYDVIMENYTSAGTRVKALINTVNGSQPKVQAKLTQSYVTYQTSI